MKIHGDVYCTSSGHYWLEGVFFSGPAGIWKTSVLLPSMMDTTGHYLPKYMESMLLNTIPLTKLKVYELNQDGVKRYENYRYHCYGLMPPILRDSVEWEKCGVCECDLRE